MQQYLKAIFAAALAGLGAAQTAYVSDGHIGLVEGITIAIAAISALSVVWGVPNLKKKESPTV
jgi:hypothetical protein